MNTETMHPRIRAKVQRYLALFFLNSSRMTAQQRGDYIIKLAAWAAEKSANQYELDMILKPKQVDSKMLYQLRDVVLSHCA